MSRLDAFDWPAVESALDEEGQAVLAWGNVIAVLVSVPAVAATNMLMIIAAHSSIPSTGLPRVIQATSAATTPSTRWPRSVCGKLLPGSIEVASVKVPAASLVTRSGVMVPAAAFVVSMVLAQVRTAELRS